MFHELSFNAALGGVAESQLMNALCKVLQHQLI